MGAINQAVAVEHAVMLYDGLCGICNHAVQWVIRHDHADRFRFAAQQSDLAAEILSRSSIDRTAMLEGNSVYLVLHAGTAREQILTQSDVTVHLLLSFSGGWKTLGYLLRLVPRFARNAAYRLFARNRYRFAQKYDACPLPTAATRRKFLL